MRNRKNLIALVVVVVIVAAGCDIVRVSVGSTGTQSNGRSSDVTLSADGTVVAFESDASNLVPADTGGTDVFVRNTGSKATTLISRGPLGGIGNGSSYQPVISGDGRYVAFLSEASNLVPGRARGVYLRDLSTNTTTFVNQDPTGAEIPMFLTTGVAISATGRYVAFNANFEVYRFDRLAGSAVKVYGGLPRSPVSISRDGRYVATESMVLTGNHSRYATVIDLETDLNLFVGPEDSWSPRLTPDGQYVVYAFEPNCWPSGFPSCQAAARGARLRHLPTGLEIPIVTSFGRSPRTDSVAVSDDAMRVAVATANDAYLLDRTTGAFTLITTSYPDKTQTGNAPTREVAISGNGTTVGFASPASNLVDADTNGVDDVFIRRP